MVPPVTHEAPEAATTSIELPRAIKIQLGLDDAPSGSASTT
jgi:hypothetical protein